MAKTYEPQAARAKALITKSGMPVSFYFEAVTEVPAGKDPNTGLNTDGIPAQDAIYATGNGLVFGYSTGEINETTIKTGDAYVLYFGDRPSKGMLFDYDGKVWKVVNDAPLIPTSVEVLNKVQIRA